MAYITLSKSALFHNLDIIAQKTADKAKIALVLKDNAYGHGIHEIAQMAKEYGITKAVVRTEEEAQEVSGLFEYILILAPRFHLPVEPHCVYTVNALESLALCTPNHRLELKVDTGMHRNGISMDEMDEALAIIQERALQLEGVFTHHRSADVMSAEWFWQVRRFEQVMAKCPGLRVHSCNSAALFRHQQCDEDLVRVGIAAYGCLEMDKGFSEHLGLKPVLSLRAKRLSCRQLQEGECVGYGASFEATKAMVVSNYDVGYADGLNRLLSNHYITPEGFKLLGRVSMDNSSYNCDVEDLLIFDDARKIAPHLQTIAYEVLTSLSCALERRIV